MTLLAQPFDATSLKLTGDPEAVADRIRIDTLLARGAYSVSKFLIAIVAVTVKGT